MRQTGGWYFGSPDSKTLTGGATARTPANALDVTVQRPQHAHARVGGPAADLKRWGFVLAWDQRWPARQFTHAY